MKLLIKSIDNWLECKPKLQQKFAFMKHFKVSTKNTARIK